MDPTPSRQAEDPTPYQGLDPDTVLQAIESVGFVTDGRMLALNSYENRVYQVGIEDAEPVVAKFYRPNRWSDAQILEEHAYALELADAEVPLVPPLQLAGETLHRFSDYPFAVFERRGGRAPELDRDDTLAWIGRFVGRLHGVGAAREFEHRPALTPERYGRESLATIGAGEWLPPHLESPFLDLGEILMTAIESMWPERDFPLRLHGDCHPGNILWRDGPFFVDLDDCQSGPAVQDLWMLLSGDEVEMARQLEIVLGGYTEFAHFNASELVLIEPLRTLRMLHHAAWIARRWDDPAFPVAFPWFGEPRYWENLLLDLRGQQARLQEPPLEWLGWR